MQQASKDKNNKRYVAGQYIELYNQSNDSVDVAGLYIGLLETDVPQAYTLDNLKTNYADSVVLVSRCSVFLLISIIWWLLEEPYSW